MQLKPLTIAVIALEDKDDNYFRGIYHNIDIIYYVPGIAYHPFSKERFTLYSLTLFLCSVPHECCTRWHSTGAQQHHICYPLQFQWLEDRS